MVGGLGHSSEGAVQFSNAGGRNEWQVAGIGWIASHAEDLASSGRTSLPRHPLLEPHKIRTSVGRRYLQRRSNEPSPDRRERKLFGIKDFGKAGSVSGRGRHGLPRAYKHRSDQQQRRGKGELHHVFLTGCVVRDRGSVRINLLTVNAKINHRQRTAENLSGSLWSAPKHPICSTGLTPPDGGPAMRLCSAHPFRNRVRAGPPA